MISEHLYHMIYTLGTNGSYTLSQKALDHIIHGDFSERQVKDATGKTTLIKVIAGGLHTFEAWENYLAQRTDITHGLLVSTECSDKWYYARELKNGVILLKIPKDCFQSKAANITKYPQTFYKSGYLWKTLFPQNMDRDQIVSAIDEALRNIHQVESGEGLIIGYTNKEDNLRSIKIRIQVYGNEIMSAFPTWEQPMSGNNGKPFSHIDSINTIIAGSTRFAADHFQQFKKNTTEKWHKNELSLLMAKTPDVIKERPKPKKEKPEREKQIKQREKELLAFSDTLEDYDVQFLVELCTSDEYSRHGMDFFRYLYGVSAAEIKSSLKAANAAAIPQNLIDMMTIICHWDIANNRRYGLQVIHHLLKIRFVRSGGLDQWELKRLSNHMCKLMMSYNHPDVLINFLKLLSISPMRIAFYTEFNLNPYFVGNPALIGLTGHEDRPMKERHFYDFVAQNLGINYTANFDDAFNIEVVRKLQIEDHPYGDKIVADFIKHAVGSEFNYFGIQLTQICDKITMNEDTIKLLNNILFDYHRCLAAQIQRVMVKHSEILIQNLDYGDPGFIRFTKAKHEYKFIWILNNMVIEHISGLMRKQGLIEQADKLQQDFPSIYLEAKKIPMPQSVPQDLQEVTSLQQSISDIS